MNATSTRIVTPEVSPLMPTDWKDAVIPGCYFVWFIKDFDVTVFGEIIPGESSAGFRCIHAFSKDYPAGKKTVMPVSAMEMLLSREQFDLARKLGWPNSEEGLNRVFGVPAN